MRTIGQTNNPNAMVPRAALIGAGLLILSSLVGVGLHQWDKKVHVQPNVQRLQPIKARQLRFVDLHDGAAVFGGHVQVFDATSGVELPQLADNEGFIKAVLNSLSFEHNKRGASGDPIFELAFWPDNRITLTDRATGARISVGQFGIGNKAAFMRFFDDAGSAQ